MKYALIICLNCNQDQDMNINIYVVIAGFTVFYPFYSALANVSNGDFEAWNREGPIAWTTLDEGIGVNRESQITYSGQYSARVTVNTRDQSSTDFRQMVSVTAGETYLFSVRVRHTEGGVRARLYVDGYTEEYSEPAIRNSWQVVSYSYRASSSRNIEVGLRFYDTSSFDGSEIIYIDNYQPSSDSGGNDMPPDGNLPVLIGYYREANGLIGFSLKTALHYIIGSHRVRGYGAIWSFIRDNDIDRYYEGDGSVLDIYSEAPLRRDPYGFQPVVAQCGNYREEGDCYNREHSFPRSWFGGDIEPMNSDIHHIFPTDGRVNAMRQSYPYGEVSTRDYTSSNGSLRGRGSTRMGYTGIVFEPIDEFKGDIARAQLYMAVRYQNVISTWETNNSRSNSVLDGSNTQVFERWYLNLLLDWHQQDPVSRKERDRNEAGFEYQGNRNPFIDHPELVRAIWQQR